MNSGLLIVACTIISTIITAIFSSDSFSMIFGGPILISGGWVGFFYVCAMVSTFILGRFSAIDSIRHAKKAMNDDINNRYKEIFKYIELSRSLVRSNTEEIVNEYIIKTKEKSNLSEE